MKPADGDGRLDSMRERVAKLLAQTETELAATDKSEDQLGAHATDLHRRIQAALPWYQKQVARPDCDPDIQSEYVWLLRHRRHADVVRAQADHERDKRGG